MIKILYVESIIMRIGLIDVDGHNLGFKYMEYFNTNK